MALPDRAWQVLNLVLHKGLGDRPIFLICHSLGGLLAKQLLRKAADTPDKRAKKLASNVRAILFLATPHAGAELASLFGSFSAILATTVSIDDLRAHDANLRDLGDWFCNHFDNADMWVESYFERRHVEGLLPIVTPTSANCGRGLAPIGLDEDHISIAKPENREAQVHHAARYIIRTQLLDPHSKNVGSSEHETSDLPSQAIANISESIGPKNSPLELPQRAEHFVGRSVELERLVNRLRERRNTAIVGIAGIGKTALAAEAVRAVVGDNPPSLSSSPYPDGIVFLDLYKLRAGAHAFWDALASKVSGGSFMQNALARVRAEEACRSRHLLVIIEGGEEATGDADRLTIKQLLEVLSPENRWLLLTRLRTQASSNETIDLRAPLDASDSATLLDYLTSDKIDSNVRQRVLTLTSGHPLALSWASGLIGRGDEHPHRLVSDWESEPLHSLSDPTQTEHTLEWLFNRSVQGVSESEIETLTAAGLLAHAPFKLSAILSVQEIADEGRAREALKGLINRGLLQQTDLDSWQFSHVLAYRFARKKRAVNPALFQRLERWITGQLLNADDETLVSQEFLRLLEHANALVRADEESSMSAYLIRSLQLLSECKFDYLGRPTLAMLALSEIRPWMDRLPGEWDGWRFSLYVNLGEILQKQGLVGEALQAYQDAATIAQRLIDDPSLGSQFLDEGSRRMHMVEAKRKIGTALHWRGDLPGSKLAYLEALELRKAIPAVDLDVSEILEKLAGIYREQGDLAAALRAQQQSVTEAQKVLDTYPDHQIAPGAITFRLRGVGGVLHAQGRFSEALDIYKESLLQLRQLAQKEPTKLSWLVDISGVLRNIGDVLRNQDIGSEAMAAYLEARDYMQQLVSKSPADPRYLEYLSDCHAKIGALLGEQDDNDSAIAAYRMSIDLMRQLASADEANADWQHDLCFKLEQMGDILSRSNHDAAILAYREGLEITQKRASDPQTSSSWKRSSAILMDKLGDIELEKGNFSAALSAYEESLSITEQLARSDPTNLIWQRDLSVSRDNIANTLLKLEDNEGALRLFQESLDIMQRIAAADPTNSRWQRDLSIGLSHIGDTLRTKDADMALGFYGRSLEISKRLAEADQSNLRHEWDISTRKNKIGDTLATKNDYHGAVSAYREALDIRRKLALSDPKDMSRQSDILSTLSRLILVHKQFGNSIEASKFSVEHALISAQLERLRAPET